MLNFVNAEQKSSMQFLESLTDQEHADEKVECGGTDASEEAIGDVGFNVSHGVAQVAILSQVSCWGLELPTSMKRIWQCIDDQHLHTFSIQFIMCQHL
jgi:hypothetical protein